MNTKITPNTKSCTAALESCLSTQPNVNLRDLEVDQEAQDDADMDLDCDLPQFEDHLQSKPTYTMPQAYTAKKTKSLESGISEPLPLNSMSLEPLSSEPAFHEWPLSPSTASTKEFGIPNNIVPGIVHAEL